MHEPRTLVIESSVKNNQVHLNMSGSAASSVPVQQFFDPTHIRFGPFTFNWENDIVVLGLTTHTTQIPIPNHLLEKYKSDNITSGLLAHCFYSCLCDQIKSLTSHPQFQVTSDMKNFVRGTVSLGTIATADVDMSTKDEYKPNDEFPTAFKMYEHVTGNSSDELSLELRLINFTKENQVKFEIIGTSVIEERMDSSDEECEECEECDSNKVPSPSEPTQSVVAKQSQVHRAAGEAIGGSGDTPKIVEALSELSGLKFCPYCSQDVSIMSKCSKKPSMYHMDLLEKQM